MKINFYPFRKNMSEEIEHCAMTNKVDNLLSFCKSCVFMTVSRRVEPECNSCMVHDAITKILTKTSFEPVSDHEPVTACFGSSSRKPAESLTF